MTKQIVAEKFPNEDYWNIWLIEGEKKETIGQILPHDTMGQIANLRNKIVQMREINLADALRELKQIIDWKNKKTKQENQHQKNALEEKNGNNEMLEEKAQELMGQFTLRTVDDTKEIFYYKEDEGIYVPGLRMLEAIIQSELNEKATRHNVSEILGKIERSTYIPREKTNNPHLIPLKNGIYNAKTQRLINYSPEYFFTSKHPIEYDPIALCPKINKFIDEISEGDIEKTITLEKIIAYCFYRDYPIQKAFMLLGSGSNGKSTLLNLLTGLLGDENISNVGLQDFEKNRFSTANLYQKNANIYSDISSESLKDPTMFKALTGGDHILCDRKFQQPFRFKNYAKLIFSCNQLPESKDDTDAFFRRWVIIEFKKKFEYREQNRGLLSEICTPDEFSGFFTQIMPRLQAMIFEHDEITNDTTEQVRKKYQRNANSSHAFAIDCMELDPVAEEEKPKIWGAYQTYCRENHLQLIASEDRFWKSIHAYFGDKIYDVRLTKAVTRERVRALRGVHLISEVEEMEDKKMAKSMSDRILERMKSYRGQNQDEVPIDFVLSGDWEDLVKVEDAIKQMRRSGIIYEMPTNHLRINLEWAVVQNIVKKEEY